MKFNHSVPILFSSDIKRSIAYYIETLGFENSWTWNDIPDFGGVSKNGIDLFFCLNGQGNPGTWLSIMVSDVNEYYHSILSKGADIVHVPTDREWGLREMLVRDPDQHMIRFGQHISIREKSAHSLPPEIRIMHRKPTPKEYIQLVESVRWNKPASDALTENILAAPIFAIVAENTLKNEAVGCVLLLGDHVSFYYVKDVIVRPDWQNKQIGTTMMKEVQQWLSTNAPDQALVGLYTGENMVPFYQQFGFRSSFGMTQRIRK